MAAPEPKLKPAVAWKKKSLRCFKYVDDGHFINKINMETSNITCIGPNGQIVKTKHAIGTQNLFRRVVRKTEVGA